METTQAIKEFRVFIENAEKLRLKSKDNIRPDDLELSQFPEFYLPNWPPKISPVEINIGLRRPWFLDIQGTNSHFLKRRFLAIEVQVKDSEGNLSIKCSHPLDMENSIRYNSDSHIPIERLNCFIIFFQYLSVILPKLIKVVTKEIENEALSNEGISRSLDMIKESFGSLIPFLVADKLAGKN